MPVEILIFSHFQLRTQKNEYNSLVLLLPVIELAPNGKNIPYITRVNCSVKGTPKEVEVEIQKAYKSYEVTELKPLNSSQLLEALPCKLDRDLTKPVTCILKVTVEYFDSDSNGKVLMSLPKSIQEKCFLYSESWLFLHLKTKLATLSELEKEISEFKKILKSSLPSRSRQKIPPMDSHLEAKISALEQDISELKNLSNISSYKRRQPKGHKMYSEQSNPIQNDNQKKEYSSNWLAIDFGTSNSTVTLFDSAEVSITGLLPKEQQMRLFDLLAEWLSSFTTKALPGVNPNEWEKFIKDISSDLNTDSNRLPEIFQRGNEEKCLEAIRQIELCLGQTQKFRRAVSKKLYEIYHDVFRVPTLESQNLIPVILDRDKGDIEISSELEIISLDPSLKVIMGNEAKENKDRALTQNTNNSSKEIISKFHHSPKRYFGKKKEFPVTVDGTQKTIPAQELIQAAWGHLIELTNKFRKEPNRKFTEGEFQMAVVTYPTIAPPVVRNEVKELVKALDINNVQTAYDEAVAVIMFFLWREFGGYLNIGIESFKTRCHQEFSQWSQNVLVLDIGGGTTDLALIKLSLKDITPPFKNSKERGLGGRYYEITPKLLGSSGHLQLGGELITLRVFRLLKVAIVDRLLTAITKGDLQNQDLKDKVTQINDRYLNKDGGYKEGSLLEDIDKEKPELDRDAYKKVLDTADLVLSTRWKDNTKRLQTFYTLWNLAEEVKIELGKLSKDESPLTFNVSGETIRKLLEQNEITIQEPENFNDFSVPLNSNQFKRAAFSVIEEAIGIATGLMESRLSDNDKEQNFESQTHNSESQTQKVDWLILSGKTCNLDIVQREIYKAFSNSDYFVWNPERITFDPQFTKLATSAGACYAEKMRQLKFSPEDAKELLSKGANQLRINVENLFYYLPCNFKRLTQNKDQYLEIFKAGQELYQFSLNDKVAKHRNEWTGIQLTNNIFRQDYEKANPQFWGSFNGNILLKKLQELDPNLNEITFQKIIKIQFEIDSELNIDVLICREEYHYLIDDSDDRFLDLTKVITENSALFSSEKLNHEDIAIYVLESQMATRSEHYTAVFKGLKNNNENKNNSIKFEKFHYTSDREKPAVKGLISDPLPPFPESGKHTFYIKNKDPQTQDEKWTQIGEISQPSITPQFPCNYHITLDENGILRLHTGEVPYWEPDKDRESDNKEEKCLLTPGWVVRTPLKSENSKDDSERDPFSGIH